MDAIQLITGSADAVFIVCKFGGYIKQEDVTAYNILCSAKTYLATGEPLIGNRTLKFFGL